MNNTKNLSQVLINTGRGEGSIQLIQGDLAEVDADIFVVSSHANPRLSLTGGSLNAIEAKFDIDLNEMQLERLITPTYVIDDEECFGTFGTHRVLNSNPLILLTRTPASKWVNDGQNAYKTVLESLVGSILYLEVRKIIPTESKVLALPVIGGSEQRRYDVKMVLNQLLTACESLLKASSTIQVVKLVVFDEELAVQYKEALEERLGPSIRSIMDQTAYKAVCEEIKIILMTIVPSSPQEKAVYGELRNILQSDKYTFSELGTLGRKLAEAIADKCCMHFNPPSVNLKRLHNTDLCIKIEALNRLVAPWIISHLHNLRFHGNVAVHFETDVKYKPSEITEHEFLATLVSIQRCLLFLQENLK